MILHFKHFKKIALISLYRKMTLEDYFDLSVENRKEAGKPVSRFW